MLNPKNIGKVGSSKIFYISTILLKKILKSIEYNLKNKSLLRSIKALLKKKSCYIRSIYADHFWNTKF